MIFSCGTCAGRAGSVTVDTISMHEIYLSIQGESTFAGLPCVLLRTAGCPLRCRWCDTPEALQGGRTMAIDEVVAQAAAFEVGLVEVTGGEPLAQAASLALLERLADRGLTVLLETSGALDIGPVDPRVHVILDVKCPGSGMSDRMCWENLTKLRPRDEVKFVVADRTDYEFMKRVIGDHGLGGRAGLLVSAASGELESRRVAEWILADRLAVRLQLQMHKFLWPPDVRGV
ncbi:MAG: radical SAM protein [Planctomycetes bacterium]|nr:radical SAM protein [Planctomycetota bacterium]